MMLLNKIGKINKLVALGICAVCFFSCRKLIDIKPPVSNVNEENVYKSDASAIAVLTGIYLRLGTTDVIFSGAGGVSTLTGLSADELTLYSGVNDNKLIAYYTNNLSASSVLTNYGSEFWASGAGLYYNIFICNAAIEGITKTTTLTPSVQLQLLGEAKFLRAFFYFYLVNLYGDVPLALTTDPAVNAIIPRSPKAQVYQQIIDDLKTAQNLLSPDYLDGGLKAYQNLAGAERVRPTKWAAAALLAKVYLYYGNLTNDAGNFAKAEEQSSIVINNLTYYSLAPLNNVFLKNSSESIWQIQPSNVGRNTEDGITFILPATGPNTSVNPVYLSNQMLGSFEAVDQRKSKWVSSVTPTPPGTNTYYFAYKYKATVASGAATEYLMMFRLGEQYLIRAEARAQQNNIGGAQADLNMIRARAGLTNTAANDKATLLVAILHERQVELFTEGHRWFDIKRTKNVDAIMNIVTPLKGGTWQITDQLYPIPVDDILKNPNLIQNAGY
ncbi:MAG: RagB/SusD family nutrient uptake outer membrane protein [Chitinophagaceae bacterium]